MTTWGLVPVKSFHRGKSRLAEVLSSGERESFARELFEHVVSVLKRTPTIDQVAVVTDAPEVAQLAQTLGIASLNDRTGVESLADVVDGALAELEQQGATRVVICMSDLPSLTPDDIVRVLDGLQDADVVLAPDLEQLGTNVLAVSPPTCLPSCFGNADSFVRHSNAARARRLTATVLLNMGTGFDVDEPTDLKRLSEHPPPLS